MRTYLYPWFEPKPLTATITVEVDYGRTEPVVIGQFGFNVSCRAVVYSCLGDLREMPLRAPTRITAGVMHRLLLTLFETDDGNGEQYPDAVDFALWAPGSKNKEPDARFRLPTQM